MIGAREDDPVAPLTLGVDRDVDLLLVHNELRLAGTATAVSGIASVTVRVGERELLAECRGSRFELEVDTRDWRRGIYPVEVTATDRDGRALSVSGAADVLPYRSPPLGDQASLAAIAEGSAAMWYEAPELSGGVVVDEYPEVRGWATAGDGLESVFVTVDDSVRLPAIHGLARPDLRAGFGEEVAADCGFALRLDPSELPPGTHVVTIVAVTRSGASIGIAGTVERVAAPGRSAAGEDAPAADDPRDDLRSGERFVPEVDRGTSIEPEHHARYRWAAPLVGDRAVLDAGCGVGWGTALLAERAATVVGVDNSSFAVGEAQRRHGAVADFRQGDMERLPFADSAFDAVVSFEAIEHVADPERALGEMRRVLRPGGLLLVSSPNRGVYPDGNPFHLRELTSDELAAILSSQFRNVAVYRQQTYVASLIADAGVLESDDASRPLDATVGKLVGGPAGSELYAVAMASDAPLPRSAGWLALGGAFDHEEHLRMVEPWRDRAVRAEIELARARVRDRGRRRRAP